MINKKIFKKVFIIFFIINIYFFIINNSYAERVYEQAITTSVSSLQINVDEEKDIMVTVQPPSLGTNVGLGKYLVGYGDRSTGEDLTRRCRQD